MVNKINKRGAVSLTIIFVILIIGFIIINGFFSLIEVGQDEYNATFTTKQNATFNNVFDAQAELDENINNTKESVKSITVKAGATQFLWNSFQGLGSILKLPLTLINVGVNSFTALIFGADVVPSWVQNLLVALLVVIISLAIIAAMTGGNPNI